jgi:nicotinate-nucleotide--dimethylbenzimidazole phosphoribosyltransferase
VAHKIKIIEQALRVNQPDAKDALDVLCKVGGLRLRAGRMIAARADAPVVVDGFISTAAMTLWAFSVCDYLIGAHQSVEIGHQAMLNI